MDWTAVLTDANRWDLLSGRDLAISMQLLDYTYAKIHSQVSPTAYFVGTVWPQPGLTDDLDKRDL